MHTEELKLNLDEKFDTKLSITDFNDQMTQIDADMADKMDPISQELESQKKTMRNLKGEFADVIEVTNSQTELLKTKVDFPELEKIWMQFDRYCMYDDLKDLYTKTVPQIAKFEVKLEEFSRDIVRQQQILGRFDEILSEKASKGNLSEFKTAIDRKYFPTDQFNKFKEEITSKSDKTLHKVNEINHLIDSLGQQITRDIFSAVKRATSHLKQNAVANVEGAGVPAIGIASEELKTLISSKADQ